MEWVSGWIQGIIIAVIISTIIEMILPEGNSKKYIKVIIGVYILFSIISPVITKITGNNFKVSDIFDLDEYIEVSKNNGSVQNQLSNQNESQIKEIYISSIKNDIKEKVENRGFIVNSIEIEIENNDQYTLKDIRLQIEKEIETTNNTQNKSENNIVETVNEIKISIANKEKSNTSNINNSKQNSTQNKKNNISMQEKKNLKEYLSGVYEISIKDIFINE